MNKTSSALLHYKCHELDSDDVAAVENGDGFIVDFPIGTENCGVVAEESGTAKAIIRK